MHNMKCGICDKTIEKYNPAFNHLDVDKSLSVDICSDCIDAFVRWQGTIYAKLFPTTAMKKIFKAKE